MSKYLLALIDLGLVIVFALSGRASHAEALSLAGIAQTAWPFGVALLLGWVILGLRQADPVSLTSGVVLWVTTWAVGMLLRAATGGGVAVAFLLVAATVLGVFLVGWRAAALLVRRWPAHGA